MSNEPVEEVLWASKSDVFGGHLTLPKYKIVDCGAFCEVIFFYISPKNLLGDFFYSLNGKAQRALSTLQRFVKPSLVAET